MAPPEAFWLTLDTDLRDRSRVLCQACNGPEKRLPNLTSLRLNIPNDMSVDTFCEKLFALPWQNLKNLHLHGVFDSYTGFANVVKDSKLHNKPPSELNRHKPTSNK